MEIYGRYKGNATVKAGMASPSCQKNMHENGNRKIFFFSWLTDGVVIPSSQM